MVEKENELAVLLEYLRRPHWNPKVFVRRRDLADDLEMRYETGLRRKEIARLKKTQYFRAEAALREVIRWKTGTVTKFFPLTERAVQIIESRLALNAALNLCSRKRRADRKQLPDAEKSLRKIRTQLRNAQRRRLGSARLTS